MQDYMQLCFRVHGVYWGSGVQAGHSYGVISLQDGVNQVHEWRAGWGEWPAGIDQLWGE